MTYAVLTDDFQAGTRWQRIHHEVSKDDQDEAGMQLSSQAPARFFHSTYLPCGRDSAGSTRKIISVSALRLELRRAYE